MSVTFYEDNRFVIGNTRKWEVVSYRLWKSTVLETITVTTPCPSKLHLLERNLGDWIQLSEYELLLYENEKS